jgi:hypothetical protein
LSSRGICRIDMRKKTAAGMCDMEVHANAPALTPVNVQEMVANPGMKQMLPKATGAKKIIAGLQCDVYEMTWPYHVSFCVSKDGSFQPSGAQSLNSGIPGTHLEVRSADRENLVAMQAKLDMAVSDAVFQVPAGVKIKTLSGGLK